MIEIDFQRGALPLPSDQTGYYHRIMVSTGRDFIVTNTIGVFEVTGEEVSGKPEKYLMWHPRVVTSNPGLAELAVRRGKIMFRKTPELPFRALQSEWFRVVRNVADEYARNIDQWGRRIVIVFSELEIQSGLPNSFEPLPREDWNTYTRVAVPKRWENHLMTAVNFCMPPYYTVTNPSLFADKVLYFKGVVIPKGTVHVRHRIGGKD